MTSPSLLSAILLISKDRISFLNVMLYKNKQEANAAIIISAVVISSTELAFYGSFIIQFRVLNFS